MERIIDIHQCINTLESMYSDTKSLSEEEFDRAYKNYPVNIILTSPIVLNESMFLFRGRLAKDVGKNEDLSKPDTFSYVPLSLNKKGIPTRGRANYNGQSIFYASTNMKTNFKEISKNSNIGDVAYMAKWILKPNSNLHLYRAIPEDGVRIDDNTNSFFCISNPSIVNSEIGAYLKKLGNIMMSNVLLGKYLGSSYIANYIYNAKGNAKSPEGNEIQFHYDGIMYPSAISDSEEINIALKPEFVDSNLDLECVFKGVLAQDMKTVQFKEIGLNEGGKIVWYQFLLDERSITNIISKYKDTSGNIVDTTKGQLFDANNKLMSSEMSVISYLFRKYRDKLFSELANFIHFSVKEGQTIDRSSLKQSTRMGLYLDLYDWNLVKDELVVSLSGVFYEFDIHYTLNRVAPIP